MIGNIKTNVSRLLKTSFSKLVPRILKAGAILGKILSFSLADDHLAPGKCLSVYLDSEAVTIAYGTRFLSRIEIKGTRYFPLEDNKYPLPDAFASMVQLALNGLNAAKADVILIVPKAWTILKKADFPIIVKENLSDVVRHEFDRLTPLSPGSAYYDYWITGENDNRLQIMLAAVKAETLDPYLDALSKKGIQLKGVVISLSAFGALSHYAHVGETTAFLEIRECDYEGGLMNKDGLTDFFSGNLSAQTGAENGALIAAKINPLLAARKTEGQVPVVFVASRSGREPLLSECLQAPVRFLDAVDLKLRFLKREKALPYTTLGAVFESLRPGSKGLNLLAKGVHRPERTPWAVTIALIIIIVAVGVFSVAAALQTEILKVEAIEREIAVRGKEVEQIHTLQKTITALAKEVDTIDRFKARPMAIDLIKELTIVLPKDTWLTRVHLTDSGVDIEGYSASPTETLRKLAVSGYFKKVEFASPTYRDPRINADHFSIKTEIETPEAANAKK